MATGELDHLARRPANAATDIEDLHAALQPHVVRKIVLVTSDGLGKGFPVCEPAEVERLAPCVLVQIRSEVIVPVIIIVWLTTEDSPDSDDQWMNYSLSGQAGIVGCPSLSDLVRLFFGLLAPMLKVFVDGCAVSGVVLAHHGADAALGSGRAPVQHLVEGMLLSLLGRD